MANRAIPVRACANRAGPFLLPSALLTCLLCAIPVDSAVALEHHLVREARDMGNPSSLAPCGLPTSLDGTCSNYRWYNQCSPYIWIFSGPWQGEGYGTLFGESVGNDCVVPGNTVKRAITYYRDVVPGYVFNNVYLDADCNADGCPDGIIASNLGLEAAERWNCSEFNACIPTPHVIVRLVEASTPGGLWATDGPYTQQCDPIGVPRSFYYPNSSQCIPWIINSPTGRNDNFLTWLIVDHQSCAAPNPCATETESASWGQIKGLFR